MSAKEVVVRTAETDEDRAAVYRLRYELYVEDQGLFQDEADHERRFLKDDLDARSQIFLVESGGALIGTARLTSGLDGPFPDDIRKTYELDRFRGIVEEFDIGVGTRLLLRHEYRGGDTSLRCLAALFAVAVEQDLELVLANCELHLVNNYLKLGFRTYGGLYNHETNGVLVRIAFILGDLEHARRLGSPLLPTLSKRKRPAAPSLIERLRAALAADQAARSKLETSTMEYVGEINESLGDGERLRGVMGSLSLEEARVLLKLSHIVTCKKGDALIRKGHVTRTLYMLLEGSLEVPGDEGPVAQFTERGTIVGEISFFSPGERITDVIAGEDGTRVLALSDRVLRELIASQGPVAAKFLHFVACGLAAKLRAVVSSRGL